MSYVIRQAEQETQKERHQKLASQSEAKLPSSVAKLKIDLSKVNLAVIIREWLDGELEALLPEDDDIMRSYVEELLENQTDSLSGSELHLQVADFLGEQEAVSFITSLWTVLESAVKDKEGIPQVIRDKRQAKTKVSSQKAASTSTSTSRPPEEAKKTNYNRSKYNANSRHAGGQAGTNTVREREGERSRYRQSTENSANYRTRNDDSHYSPHKRTTRPDRK